MVTKVPTDRQEKLILSTKLTFGGPMRPVLPEMKRVNLQEKKRFLATDEAQIGHR
jgi:hypothetical protein